MECLGTFHIILIISNIDLPDKVRKLKDDVRKVKTL